MGNAKYIGRVGGLAVALGVGIAIATTPGAAWAEPSDSDSSSSSSTGSAKSTSAGDSNESDGASAEGSAQSSDGLSTGSHDEADVLGDNYAHGGTKAGESPKVKFDSSGGRVASTYGTVETSDEHDIDAARSPVTTNHEPTSGRPTTDVPDSSSASSDPEPPTRRKRLQATSKNPPRPVTTTRLAAPDASARSAEVGAPPSRPAPPQSISRTVADAPAHLPATPKAVTAPTPRTLTTATLQTKVPAPQLISAVPPEVSAAPTARSLVLNVMESMGFLATNSSTPVEPPLGWAVLALVGSRRFDQTVAEEPPDLLYNPTLTTRSQTFDAGPDQQTIAGLTTMTVPNSAPYAPPQPTGGANPVTGEVTGTVVANDAEGDPLSYTVTGAPLVQASTWATAKGSVSLDQTTGAYRYMPTQAARVNAGTTDQLDTDTFTVAVSDGQQAVTTQVPVYVSPVVFHNQTGTSVGTNPSAVIVSPDGKRMYVANTGSNTVSVVDTATGTLIDTNTTTSTINSISVGSSPSALLLNGNRLYVANRGSNTVSVINTDTYQRIDANPSLLSTDVAVGTSPSALALSGNRLYVANAGSNTVSVINTDTFQRIDANPSAMSTDITVGSAPSAVALSSDGSRLYVANRTSGTVSVIRTDTFQRIDADPSSSSMDIRVASSPSAIAVSGDRLYVANTGSGTVSVIRTDTYQAVAAINVGASPSSVTLSPDGSLAYVASGADTLAVIYTKDNSMFANIAIDPSAENGGHITAVSPDGSRIYVTDAVDRTVRVVALTPKNTAPVVNGTTVPSGPDPVTGVVTGRMNVRDPDGDRLIYTLAGAPTLGGTVTFNQQTGVFTYTPSHAARDLATGTSALDYDTFGVSVSDGISTVHTTVRVEVAPTALPTTPVTTTAVNAGSGPSGSAVAGNYVYVVNYDSNNVTVINSGTNQFDRSINVGQGPLSVAATANRVYVSNSSSNTVSVISSTSNEVIRTIAINVLNGSYINPWDGETVIEYPNRVTEVAASGNRLYANATDGRITVIDTTGDANTIVGTPAPLGVFNDLKVSPDGTRLYGTSGNGLTVITTSTMTPVGVQIGSTWNPDSLRNEYTNGVANVAVSGKRAYVTYGVSIAERAVGGQSSGSFFTDAQGRTWMWTGGYSAVAVIDADPASANYNKQIATVIVPQGVQDVAVGGTNVYVTSGDGKTVSVIDASTNTLVSTFTTDQTSSAGRAIYLPDEWYPLYNIAAFTRYITVGPTGKVYITDYTDGTLYVATTATVL